MRATIICRWVCPETRVIKEFLQWQGVNAQLDVDEEESLRITAGQGQPVVRLDGNTQLIGFYALYQHFDRHGLLYA